ncbi:protein bunched, class 2/F/G isoform-like isoform X1 [Wyeomyia smithii]|uniref:protein bunched, class 2/F/G isoform-like isoform X1 n=1 Tax=Wyeomyia smithii TaxID=174621 RepID=UPI002467B136|nr:protein bunched, class 2/F/G isoform-like isoform X1 [Wyeomyia smithii]
MAENSVGNSLPPSHHKTAGVGGGGGLLLHNKSSLEMTTGGGSGSTAGSVAGKTTGGGKHANVIHRTTSESLRLGGAGGGNPGSAGGSGSENSSSSTVPPSLLTNSSSASMGSLPRKGGAGGAAAAAAAAAAAGKTSSFMITSVTVGARTSADNGDDSADDLDESHTDDNSRITDFENETPSFSEDTFSKEDVFFASNAIGSVPVIPTSSQYGLAIVAPNDRAHGAEALADAMHVSVTDAGINIMGHGKDDGKELHHRNERFKVVKIESTEPFKRGRWVCMDYLDHTTLQASPKEGGEGETSANVEASTMRNQDSGVVLNDSYAPSTAPTADGDNSDYHTHLAASVPTNPIIGTLNNESPGQSLNLAQSTIGNTGGGVGGGGTISQSQPASHVTPAVVPHSMPQSQLQNALAGSGTAAGASQPPQQVQTSAQPQGQTPYYPHTMSNITDITQQQHPPQQQQQQQQHHHQHGATLPTNIQMQPQQTKSSASATANVVLPPVGSSSATSQEMNIVISNPQHHQQQTSFPSPQQFQPQSSQTNSPVVASIGEQVASEATILSPSPSMASSGAIAPATTNVATGANVTAQQQQQVTEPVGTVSSSSTSEPMVASSSSTTSSPVTATATGGNGDNSSTPTSVNAPAVPPVSSPSLSVASVTATTTTTNSSSNISSQHASIAAAAAAAAATAASDHLTESNLLSAVAGVTAAAVAAAGAEDGEKSGEDGESYNRIWPVMGDGAGLDLPDYGRSVPYLPPDSSTGYLQQELQQNNPVDRTKLQNSSCSTSSVSSKNNIYTDIALGKSIRNLMRPSSIGNPHVSASNPFSPSTEQQTDPFCRTACNFVNNNSGSHSIATCTVQYPHKCVQDLIREELGAGGLLRGSTGNLSNTGSMVNIHIESELPHHYHGYQSHPGSGRSSPASQMFHYESPPKHLSAIGHSVSIPCSTRVSRAPSPSFLPAAGGEHSSASGTSAVAIDNKIEQAMDLVKSHLMFAVREEVEVLKEKISELMDRINQLEYENNILKANASQETLSQLTTTGGGSVGSGGGGANSSTTAAATVATAAGTAPTPASKVPSSANSNSNGSVS